MAYAFENDISLRTRTVHTSHTQIHCRTGAALVGFHCDSGSAGASADMTTSVGPTNQTACDQIAPTRNILSQQWTVPDRHCPRDAAESKEVDRKESNI